MTVVLGVDIGGSGIKAATFGAEPEPRSVLRVATPRGDADGHEVADAVAGLVERARSVEPVASIALAAPGIVDEAAGTVLRSENLGWERVPIRALVAERVGEPISFGHDVRLGGLAEFRLGAARGHDDALFVPIGTGISVASLADGRLITAGGWAGELGMRRSGGNTLEQVASASGLARRLGVADGVAVVELVRAGDRHAVAVWDAAMDALGDVLAAAVLTLGTRCVVVGGGLSLAGVLLLDPLRDAMRRRLGTFPEPVVTTAVLGDLAGCHGAALLARRAAR